jgi:hypothetical protein
MPGKHRYACASDDPVVCLGEFIMDEQQLQCRRRYAKGLRIKADTSKRRQKLQMKEGS